jgi:hypothetical protein
MLLEILSGNTAEKYFLKIRGTFSISIDIGGEKHSIGEKQHVILFIQHTRP